MNIKLIPVGKGSKFTFPALPEKVQGKYAAKGYRSRWLVVYATGNKQTGGKTWLEKGTLPGMRDTLLAETGGCRGC